MKKFVGFYYRCSFNVCLWAFLALISLMFLSSPAFSLQSGDFTYSGSGGTVTITGYTGAGGAVVIPSAINGMPVVSIGDMAFMGSTGLTSVTIGKSVMGIGQNAFLGCTGLTSVTIPDSVTSIGWEAFMGCSGLTSAFFLGNAPSMEPDVFFDCAYNFTICYTDGSTGFGTPFYGYPAEVCAEPTSSTTTVQSTTTTTSIMPTSTTSSSSTSTSPTTSSSSTTTIPNSTIPTTVPTTIPSVNTVDFVGSPTTGSAPLSVHFTNLSSGNISGYLWDFGDGSTSGELNPTHLYTKWGNYAVILTAYSTDGTSKQAVKPNYVLVSSSCPFLSSLDNPQDIHTLRIFRDSMLNNISGIILTSFYYKNHTEISKIIADNPELQNRLQELVAEHIGIVQDFITGRQATISRSAVNDAVGFLYELQKEGSLKLQNDIYLIIMGIEDGYLLKGMGMKVE